MAQVSAPEHELQIMVEGLHQKYLPLSHGELASYIPELTKANPDDFGISLVTSDGQVFETGSLETAFTIQSISKPFTFGMVIEEHGHKTVLEYVGIEPSGDAFNSIELEHGTNRPFNPMVNSGAIAVTSLLYATHGDRALDVLMDRFSAMAGRRLVIDQSVYESERRTGHRNRAIAHLLMNFGVVRADAEAALDLYFKQCSIIVTAHDLAVMGATLSNMGRNPITNEAVCDPMCVKDMLSIMFTCGMYDYSGQWAYRVGIPAKSGVAGGVLAVVNRQLGIGTYSPRLDPHGNSCRGIEACTELANRLGLHVFDCLNVGSSFLTTVLGS